MATAETFVKCAASVILRKGLRGTGLNEIISATDLTKGAFYYYFKDKNDFYIHYIRYMGQITLESLESELERTDASPSQRMLNFFENRSIQFEKSGFVGGCPLGNMSQEIPDGLPQLRSELEKALDSLAEAIGRNLEICRNEGLLRLKEDASVLSLELLSAWQGALMYAKLYKKFDALDTFLNFHFGISGWFEDQPYNKNQNIG